MHYLPRANLQKIPRLMDASPPCACKTYTTPRYGLLPKIVLAATGDPTPSHQVTLKKEMQLKYKNVIGELIYALVTCRPDISYAVVKCAQATTVPHEIHFHALCHVLKYLYVTPNDGIYFWQQTPHNLLPDAPLPTITCPPTTILSTNRPQHAPLTLHGYVDSDWATCPKTC